MVLAFVLLFSFIPISKAEASTKNLKVHFIDVGQGDAIFVQAPRGKTMLVDGGSKASGDEVVAFLKEKGIKRLDYVVATHPDADHIGGLIEVLETFKVRHFINSGKAHSSETYEELLTLVDKKDIDYIVAETWDTYKLDSKMTVRVLHADEEAEENNDASIVLNLTYNKVSFLLMADASLEIEKEIRKKYDVEATVLKVGHHGADTSSSAKFISDVNPEVAILSYGRNNIYGHPHSKVIKRLKNVGADIYKTATDCNITVTTNGANYSVTTDCTKPAAEKKWKEKISTGKKFKNCTELRDVYPSGVSSSHEAYRSKLDRDKDDWACENY